MREKVIKMNKSDLIIAEALRNYPELKKGDRIIIRHLINQSERYEEIEITDKHLEVMQK